MPIKPNDNANVTVSKGKVGGYIFYAPEGTALPADAKTPLAEAFINLGYVEKDGISSKNDKDSKAFEDLNGTIVYQTVTSRKETYEFSLIEALRVDVLKQAYGDGNVTGTLETGITVKHTSTECPRGVYVFEFVLNGGIINRVVIPKGQVTEVSATDRKVDALFAYKTKLACYEDDKGVSVYEYYAKAAK